MKPSGYSQNMRKQEAYRYLLQMIFMLLYYLFPRAEFSKADRKGQGE